MLKFVAWRTAPPAPRTAVPSWPSEADLAAMVAPPRLGRAAGQGGWWSIMVSKEAIARRVAWGC